MKSSAILELFDCTEIRQLRMRNYLLTKYSGFGEHWSVWLKKLKSWMFAMKNPSPKQTVLPLREAIWSVANSFKLKPEIVAAMVFQESGGDSWATRYEDGFYNRYIDNLRREDLLGWRPDPGELPTLRTEKRLRATSFGLMQMMGETARENEFEGRYLTELCDPNTNLDICCRFLRRLIDEYTDPNASERDRYTEALRRYNGSSDYPPIIWGHVEAKRYEQMFEDERKAT